MTGAPDAVARGLALALLAAGDSDWTEPGVVTAASDALGLELGDADARWLPGLAHEVLRRFPRAPHDEARLLAVVVDRSGALGRGRERARAAGRTLRVVHPGVVEPGSAETDDAADDAGVRAPDGRPELRGVGDLAGLLGLTIGELEWFADTRLWNRRHPSGPLQHHRYVWRARPGRTPRLLEVPGFRLRDLQRVVLDRVLAGAPVHDAAHGFVPGRSALTGAAVHSGSEVVVALDLRSFFARVTVTQAYGALRREGLPEPVAHLLVGLCTNAVPAAVLAAMPPGGELDERIALRRALAVPHLAQGAPTSPALANLAMRRLDSRLAGWAAAAGARYTRYADDLSFSGGPEVAARADAFVRGVGRIVADEGHELNPHKTRVRGAATRQTVTGIVVNSGTNVTRASYDRLRAMLHNAASTGLEAQNRGGEPDFRAHVLGRIGWVEQLNPARGARLRELLARVPR